MAERKLKNLSNNPGTAILQALADLRVIERRKNIYEVDMGVYHTRATEGYKCYVCLAGCVMALRDNLTPDVVAVPDSFRYVDEMKLRAIDLFRVNRTRGLHTWCLAVGLRPSFELASELTSGLPWVPAYSFNPKGFKRNLTIIGKRLQKHWPAFRRKVQARQKQVAA